MARYCKVQQTQIEKEVWRVCSSTTSTTLPGLTRGKHAEAAKLTRWYQDSEIKHHGEEQLLLTTVCIMGSAESCASTRGGVNIEKPQSHWVGDVLC